jgi:uncharacterized phiE125 gp8 family phage protein
MSLTVTTPPAEVPVSLTELKDHLRVDLPDEDSYITDLGAAVTAHTESITSRTLIATTFSLKLNAIPANQRIELPRSNATSITSVTLIDVDDVSTVVDNTVYELDDTGERDYVHLQSNQSWPSVDLKATGGVVVVFVAGYDDPASVPESMKSALKLLVAHLYENREPFVVGTIIQAVPMSYDALIAPFTVDRVY